MEEEDKNTVDELNELSEDEIKEEEKFQKELSKQRR